MKVIPFKTRREIAEKEIQEILYKYTKDEFIGRTMNIMPSEIRNSPMAQEQLRAILNEEENEKIEGIENMVAEVFNSLDFGIEKTIEKMKILLNLIGEFVAEQGGFNK